MAKLFNTRLETIALRSLCSKDPTVGGFVMAHLDDSHFYNDECVEVFNRIKSSFNKTGRMPAFRILMEDVKLSESARELLSESEGNVADIDQARALVSSLNDLRKTRLYYLMARGILDTLEKSKVDIEELSRDVSKKAARIASTRGSDAEIISFGADSNAWELVRQQLYEDEDQTIIPTGFDTWDRVNGGFLAGSLVVLGGSSGAGKSILGNQLAVNQAEAGFRASFAPLEMASKEMLSRTMSSVSGMDSIKIVLHKLATNERDLVWKRMKRFNRRITQAGGQYTVVKPKADVTMEELSSMLHGTGSDVDYIDYISLLNGVGGDDAWKKLGEVARFGKIYAENHNKVIVLLAQVSEDGKIRYSQTIKEHASVGWTFVANKETKSAGYLNISTIKSRNQVEMDFTLKINYAQTSVSDLDSSELQKLEAERAQKAQQPKSSKKTAGTPANNYVNAGSADDSMLPDL